MLKTLRFYAKYMLVLMGGYAAFVAVILGGTLITGLDGLFGTYTSMLPSMGVIFIGIFATSTTVYLEVAVSMGARRSHCFWAVELTNAVFALFMLLLAVLVQRILSRLPDPQGVLYHHSARAWLTIYTISLVVLQSGLIASQFRDPKKMRWGRMGMILFTVFLMVGVTVSSVLSVVDNRLTGLLWPGWLSVLLGNLPLVLAALALILGFFAYRGYQKAVVVG